MNLNSPQIIPGRIDAADLDAARQHSTGAIHMAHPYTGPGDERDRSRIEDRTHRVVVCPPCHGNCDQSDKCPARPANVIPCSTLARWALAFKRWWG